MHVWKRSMILLRLYFELDMLCDLSTEIFGSFKLHLVTMGSSVYSITSFSSLTRFFDIFLGQCLLQSIYLTWRFVFATNEPQLLNLQLFCKIIFLRNLSQGTRSLGLTVLVFSKTTIGCVIPPTRHLTPPDSASSHLTFRLRTRMPAQG